jgi:hypothetical protein
MKHATVGLILNFLFGSLFLHCSKSTESISNSFQIEKVSFSNMDSLEAGSGIIIQFNKVIDLNSLNAQFIQTDLDTIALDIYKIESSANVLLNSQPLTFWYHPATRTIAGIEVTTVEMPEGTGEGLVFGFEENQLLLKSGIKDDTGKSLGTDYALTFYRSTAGYRFRIVPNPKYPQFGIGAAESLVKFINLPLSFHIEIKDINDNELINISHGPDSSAGFEFWDLKDANGVRLPPGIYKYEISNNEIDFIHGVFVLYNDPA